VTVGPQTVWYVAYGSNLASRRFGCYLKGGRPAGGRRRYVGCRDPSDPVEDVFLEVPGGLVFAGSSGMWGGGMAVYDPDAEGRAAVRAYRITVEQLADVVAQEMRRPPGGDFTEALVAALPGVETARVLGAGRYETLIGLGVRDGAPLVTVTASDVGSLDLAAPTETYLRWVAEGLRESHGWAPERIGAYLASAPGARDAWTAGAITALATDSPP
jgi:hypothetical protein